MQPYTHLPEHMDVRVGDLVIYNDAYGGRIRLPTSQGRIEWIGHHTYGIDFGEDQVRIVRKEYVKPVGRDAVSRSQPINAERSYDAMVIN